MKPPNKFTCGFPPNNNGKHMKGIRGLCPICKKPEEKE